METPSQGLPSPTAIFPCPWLIHKISYTTSPGLAKGLMQPSRKLINWFDGHHHFRPTALWVVSARLSYRKISGFGWNCIETQKDCTLDQDKNPTRAFGAGPLHSKKQHIFCRAHDAGDKHICSPAVPAAPFTLYLFASTGHKVVLYKGKYQVMLLRVWYISHEEVPISQSSVIISFLHCWHLDP